MIDIQDYFKDSKDLSDSELIKANISAEELIKIYYDYIKSLKELEAEGIYLSNRLQFCEDINSVRWRTKDPVHLLTKIVRKRKEAIERKDNTSKYLTINEKNYKKIITDLIGLRAIYLFKFQWKLVDNFICENFKINHDEKIVIYHAPEDDLKFYYEDGYKKEVDGASLEYSRQKKNSKYRSTHYIVEANFPHDFKLEIQIRSILDEAWGEIDHFIRYPDHQNDEDLQRKMTILNGAINGCEELATNYIEDVQKKTLGVVKGILFEDEAEHEDSETAEHEDSETAEHEDSETAEHEDSETAEHGGAETAESLDLEVIDPSKKILEAIALQSDVSRIANTAFLSNSSKEISSYFSKNLSPLAIESLNKYYEEILKAKRPMSLTESIGSSYFSKNLSPLTIENISKYYEEMRGSKQPMNLTGNIRSSALLNKMSTSAIKNISKQEEELRSKILDYINEKDKTQED